MAARLACQQAIASDGAFAVAMLAEFADSLQASPWRFNQLYQEAGLIGQSLYIDAEALGLRGTGIGCFLMTVCMRCSVLQGKASKACITSP